ncbi:MAG: hypothetical protein N2606_02955, partial [Candidatus Omnitrophica bacterium]|nr:hypothetical protein [Candidatus Omnitrophota bacterium]
QVIVGEAGLLKKEFVKDLPEDKQKEVVESFDYIIEAAKRVSGMVKAIRDFGQPTRGELKPLVIEEVVDSFIKLYYPQFKANAVVFEKVNSLSRSVYVRCEKTILAAQCSKAPLF